ncbi:hypothetical protein DENSPDRAFT_832040 [Dentipellis sp. KUC8613]|nr:hypothetical protein DENSPDRAFT_832040 [Dentipellis sp. KUC8613]
MPHTKNRERSRLRGRSRIWGEGNGGATKIAYSPHEPKAYQRQPDSQCMQRSMPVVSSLSCRLLSIRYRMLC